MPYLTPESIPEADDCRPLFIPSDGTWLALFGGALTELTKSYNWEQFGALTVAETVAKMQSIVDNWYEGVCSACTTPGGYRVIRISVTGHIEQLNDAGEWETATDEYYIPPPAAREGGSPEDQICLAANNAVNVLQELYESISDSWNGDLDEAEAVTAMIAVFAGTVGFAIAPITWGIFAFFAPIFAAMYALVEYVIADLWDAAVSDQITCFLVECATNTDGVVTFDYDCFYAKLNSLANGFSLTVEQIRLYLQIQYLLYFIGGIDGLNLAATTTEISVGDCPCFAHCHLFDFTEIDGDFIPGYPDFAPPAAYVSDWVTDEGWSPSGSPAIYNGFYRDFDPIVISQLTVHWVGGDESMGACGNISIEVYLAGTQQAVVSTDQSWQTTGALQILGSYTADRIIVSGNNCPNTGWTFDWLEVSYEGDPVFGVDNC